MTDHLPARAENVVDNKIASLSGTRDVLTASWNTETPEGKIAAFNALTDAQPIAEHLDETINLRHYAAQVVEIVDEENGGTTEVLRIILVDDDGTAYAAMSDGLFRSLQNLVGVFGDPNDWAEPLPIVVTEVRGRAGFRYYTVKLATGK